jgi:hypothetical protein
MSGRKSNVESFCGPFNAFDTRLHLPLVFPHLRIDRGVHLLIIPQITDFEKLAPRRNAPFTITTPTHFSDLLSMASG